MGFLVSLFAMAASVWAVPIVRRGNLLAMIAAVLVLGTVAGPFFFSIDGPIQFSLDRLVWAGLFVIAAIRWRLGKLRLPKLHRVDAAIIGLVGYLLWSCTRGGDPPGETSPLARWIFYIFMPAGTYALVRVTRLYGDNVESLLKVWTGLGIYLSLTGICEVMGMRSLVFPAYINDPSFHEFFGRGRGPLLNPIANGVIIGGALVSSVLLAIRGGKTMRVCMGLAAAILLAGIYSTLTRSCWVGAVGAVVAIAFFYTPRWLRVWSLAVAVLLAGAASMGLKDQLLAFKRDKELSAVEAAKSIELRPLLAVVAWEMFQDKPIVGHGFGHYFEHNEPYHNDRGYDLPLDRVRVYFQHNAFLALLVDGGLIALGLLLFILGTATLQSLRMIRTRHLERVRRTIGLLWIGMLVVYVANAMFHDLTIIPMVQMFVMTMIGLVVNAAQRGPTVRPATVTDPSTDSLRTARQSEPAAKWPGPLAMPNC